MEPSCVILRLTITYQMIAHFYMIICLIYRLSFSIGTYSSTLPNITMEIRESLSACFLDDHVRNVAEQFCIFFLKKKKELTTIRLWFSLPTHIILTSLTWPTSTHISL